MANERLLDETRASSKLQWRCRRGLLENDLFIERFFDAHEAQPDRAASRRRSSELMDLRDNDLLDLLLARKEPEGELAAPTCRNVLALMRARQCRNSNYEINR